MDAIRLVRSRELASRMRFWTAIVGYDPRDRSVSHRLYLVYLVIFFSLWGFSVLILLADAGKWFLSFFKGLAPAEAAVVILATVLLLDAVARGYRASRRSPFVFSEEDAGLICQTPVNRSQVALMWLLGDWLPACLPFVVLGVILCFSSLQLAEPGPFLWTYLPRYWLAAFRVTSIILFMHLALMAAGFTLGALRLRGAQDLPGLRWIPVGFSLLVVSLVITNQGLLGVFLWPVIFPLAAGFGTQDWLYGIGLAIALALIVLLVLYSASSRLNLSRAAQESRSGWAYRQASLAGDARLTQKMKIRDRLGVQHPPSRISGRAGVWSLVWKDGVITLRTINARRVLTWLGIFGISLGMVVAPDWGTKIWALILWCWLVGAHGTERLHSDLEQWLISRQLPFRYRSSVAAELVLPVLITIVLTWLAVAIGAIFGFSIQIGIFFVAPAAAIIVVMAAAYDMIRKCHGSELLTGQVSEPGAVGVVLGGVLAGIPMLGISGVASQFNSPATVITVAILGLTLGLLVAYFLWELTASAYRSIK